MAFIPAVRVVGPCIILAMAYGGVAAQGVPVPTPSSVLGAVCPTAYVRIVPPFLPPAEGKCRLVGADSLVMVREGLQQHFATTKIDTIWTRHANTGRGALIGAGAGAVALTTLGIVFVNGLCDPGDTCSLGDYPVVALFGVAVGGGVGAIIGGSVGAAVRSWVRQYP